MCKTQSNKHNEYANAVRKNGRRPRQKPMLWFANHDCGFMKATWQFIKPRPGVPSIYLTSALFLVLCLVSSDSLRPGVYLSPAFKQSNMVCTYNTMCGNSCSINPWYSWLVQVRQPDALSLYLLSLRLCRGTYQWDPIQWVINHIYNVHWSHKYLHTWRQ